MEPWQQIHTAIQRREPVAVATIVRDRGSVPRRTGAKMLVHADGRTHGSVGGGIFETLVIRDARAALKLCRSETRSYSFTPRGVHADSFGAVCGGSAEVFLEVIMPPDRLLIIGGGHCGRALAEAAAPLDFTVTIADDREEFARPQDYAMPHVERVLHVSADYRDLPAPDAQTYVAIVTRGYITDEAALRRVIDCPSAYIGMIGSQRKRDTVFDNMRADGVSEAALARVHAPIGIEIGAETPAEIAVSILAQIIQVRAALRGSTHPAEEKQEHADAGAATSR